MLFKPEKPSPDEEAMRARRKHKDVILDVKELPEVTGRERVILLDSLDELIKTADDLLKPVLHRAEKGRHTYCVLDGMDRFEYISEFEFLKDKQDGRELNRSKKKMWAQTP